MMDKLNDFGQSLYILNLSVFICETSETSCQNRWSLSYLQDLPKCQATRVVSFLMHRFMYIIAYDITIIIPDLLD